MTLQEQLPHQDAGFQDSISVILQLAGVRKFQVFNCAETITHMLHPGDMILFNRNVWHRGCVNDVGSTCVFLYLDTRSQDKKAQGFDKVVPYDEYMKYQATKPPHVFEFHEPSTLKEIPVYINNAFRDRATTHNTGASN